MKNETSKEEKFQEKHVILPLVGTKDPPLNKDNSRAFELSSQLGTAGAATFKVCDDCDRQNVRVTNSTRYQVNGRAVRLTEFKKAIAQVNSRSGVALTVLHHLESDTIELINVSL